MMGELLPPRVRRRITPAALISPLALLSPLRSHAAHSNTRGGNMILVGPSHSLGDFMLITLVIYFLTSAVSGTEGARACPVGFLPRSLTFTQSLGF